MISQNTNIKSYNTFGIDVTAKYFGAFSSIEEIKPILQKYPNEELLLLGGGSNVLFTNDNFDGLVLVNQMKGFEVVEETADYAIVKSGAGEVWHEFVLNCIDRNLGGVENLSLIPGSVGASPMQNIGAYGVEIKHVFEKLEAYHLASGEVHTFSNDACEFGYRESVFKRKLKNQYIITAVYFRLTKKTKVNTSYGVIESELVKMGVEVPTIKDVSNAVIAIRSSKLPNPKEIGNAGSFFKNPVVPISILENIQKEFPEVPNYPAGEGEVKLAAGWLIEKAGWKGKTLGHYGVHKLQALVLVNYGGATGKEIYDLSTSLIEDVKTKFGVTLEREVNIIG
jgi:UDP-N-acetylmuramate dehydrogenase